MNRTFWLLALSALLMLSACGGDNGDIEAELNLDRSGFIANFDLANSIIPFPSNLLFNGTEDGTLNIPVADPDDGSDPIVAMNALDGFSTVAPISTTFSVDIDATTLTAETVRVFEVTLSGIGGGVTGITRELDFDLEFFATLSSVDPTNSTLVILPTAPLNSSSSYLVMLTDGIESTDGVKGQASASYVIVKSANPLSGDYEPLEGVRQLVNSQEAALESEGVDTDTVILSWTFTTQSVGVVLNTARFAADGTAAIYTPVGTTATILEALGIESPGFANVYVGGLEVPYYLTNADSLSIDPLTKYWTGAGGSNLTAYNSTPVETSIETIPMLVSVPNVFEKPEDGWPTVIFQHGITSNRTAMLAAADSLAAAGFAVVAIDLPLHGLMPPTPDSDPSDSPLYAGNFGMGERTFDLNLDGDDSTDSSGTYFINLTSLLTSRDNVRQAVADLFALTEALPGMEYVDEDILVNFDADNIYFVGHSLGGIVGGPFLALEPNVRSAVLGMSGGGIAKLLDGSAEFGPRIAAGLAANGVVKGTADYESFLGATQTVVDSADPINYTEWVGSDRGVLLFEVIGDQVVPNNVMADAPEGTALSPLAGTDPLAYFMGLQTLSESTEAEEGSDLDALLRFTSGDHSSILDPRSDPLVTGVMQTAMARFLETDGAEVTVINETVLE